MAIKKLYSSDSRRKTISKLNNNFLSIAPDVILEISDKTPTENMDNIIWIDTSMDIITKEINTQTYTDEYFASHPDIDKRYFKFVDSNGDPTLEFKKMLYGDDYSPSFRYILHPKNNKFNYFTKNIEKVSKYNLKSLKIDTKNVTDMSNGFYVAKNLVGIDVSDWDTSKVTNMENLFYNCLLLTDLDVSKWDTSKVTNMADIFGGCSKLQSINVSKWNTSSVTDMSYIFYGCSSTRELDVSKWDTSKVTSMRYMFYNCTNIKELDISNWDTSKVTRMDYMFSNCTNIVSIKGVLDFKNIENSEYGMGAMFSNCNKLTSVTVMNLPTDIDRFCRIAGIDKSKVIVVE